MNRPFWMPFSIHYHLFGKWWANWKSYEPEDMRDPSDVDATLQEADKKYADDVASTLPDCESLEMIPGCDSLEKEVPLLVHCQHPHVMFFFWLACHKLIVLCFFLIAWAKPILGRQCGGKRYEAYFGWAGALSRWGGAVYDESRSASFCAPCSGRRHFGSESCGTEHPFSHQHCPWEGSGRDWPDHPFCPARVAGNRGLERSQKSRVRCAYWTTSPGWGQPGTRWRSGNGDAGTCPWDTKNRAGRTGHAASHPAGRIRR